MPSGKGHLGPSLCSDNALDLDSEGLGALRAAFSTA